MLVFLQALQITKKLNHLNIELPVQVSALAFFWKQ